MKATINAIIAIIVAKFAQLNGAKLVGIRDYTSKTSGEVCNHVVNAGFSYGEAVRNDLKKLNGATLVDLKAIAKKANVAFEIVETAIAEMKASFVKNQNPATASKQSIAQKEAYIPITTAIKLNKETNLIHIYAMAMWKDEPSVKGTFKVVKSRPLTIAKKAVKKYYNFTTAKYRNFIVHPDMISEVAITGEVLSLK
jgi:hypothetical protein